jgi:hypothetical protein
MGDAVIAHIEIIYPAALATRPNSFLISVGTAS